MALKYYYERKEAIESGREEKEWYSTKYRPFYEKCIAKFTNNYIYSLAEYYIEIASRMLALNNTCEQIISVIDHL